MKENNSSQLLPDRSKINLIIIPDDLLTSLINKQNQILDLLADKQPIGVNGFVTEKKAMELINKKVTWFWQMRKNCKLPYKTIGRTVYYSLKDLNSLL